MSICSPEFEHPCLSNLCCTGATIVMKFHNFTYHWSFGNSFILLFYSTSLVVSMLSYDEFCCHYRPGAWSSKHNGLRLAEFKRAKEWTDVAKGKERETHRLNREQHCSKAMSLHTSALASLSFIPCVQSDSAILHCNLESKMYVIAIIWRSIDMTLPTEE